MNAQQLYHVLNAAASNARGNYGDGELVRSAYNELRENKRVLNKYIKRNKQTGKKVRMQDGSVGYGKYRRTRRRGRGQYVIPGILGAAKQLGKNIFGLGRYRRRVRRGRGAYGDSVVDQDIPIFANPEATDGPVTIRHREYVTDITSSTAFAIQHRYVINPGNSQTFPWLSQIAANFSQYRFEGISFHFVSTSGNITSNQALGEIVMSVDYDPSGKEITSKQEMLAIPFSVSKAPCTDSECPVECAPSQTHGNGLLNVRNGAPAGQDKRFFDLGQFVQASSGQSANGTVLGELWVTYQVALYKPQLPSMEEGGGAASVKSSNGFIVSLLNSSVLATYPSIQFPWANINGGQIFQSYAPWSNWCNMRIMNPFGYVGNQMFAFDAEVGQKYEITWHWQTDTAQARNYVSLAFGNPTTGVATGQIVSGGLYKLIDTSTGLPTFSWESEQPDLGTSTKDNDWSVIITALESSVYIQILSMANPPSGTTASYMLLTAQVTPV